MGILYGFLIVLEVILSFLLIVVIFMQKSKGGMGGSAFGGGGGAGEAIFGSRMGNVLTKATVVLAVAFLANTLMLTVLTARQTGAGSVMDQVQPTAPQPQPGQGQGQGPMQMPGAGDMEMEGGMPYATPDAPVEQDVLATEPEDGASLEAPAPELPASDIAPPSPEELTPDQEALPAAMPNLPAAE